jgi:hypothetical protein
MTTTYQPVTETLVDDFRPGYSDLLITHFAKEFDWRPAFTREVLRDAIRFLSVCAIPPTGHESSGEAPVMVSSPIVDRMVDALLLDVPLMIWLEREVMHCRMVHVPAYAHGITDQAINDARYDFTVSLMEAAGYELDRAVIWPRRLPVGYRTCTNRNDLLDCEYRTLRH